ncbi:MAG: MEDS domain-containing protein [Spirochaetota bacterium]
MYIQTSKQDKLHLGVGSHDCNWGAHIAGLYESAADRDKMLLGFLHAGDEAGDLQFYAPSERSIEDFKRKYSEAYPSVRNHVDNPDLFQLSSPQSLYYPEGVFSPWTMDENLKAIYRESQKRGRRNVRATAEMVWARKAIPGTEHLMAYEARLNYFITGKPWISLCLYNINEFDSATIRNVLRTHPYILQNDVISASPYYQEPEVWLLRNAPQFLNR